MSKIKRKRWKRMCLIDVSFFFVFLFLFFDKLNHCGFRGIINDWFSSYLQDRTQTTQVGPHISKRSLTTCIVLHGSVLGPLLFLFYINDIYTCSSHVTYFKMFLGNSPGQSFLLNKSMWFTYRGGTPLLIQQHIQRVMTTSYRMLNALKTALNTHRLKARSKRVRYAYLHGRNQTISLFLSF